MPLDPRNITRTAPELTALRLAEAEAVARFGGRSRGGAAGGEAGKEGPEGKEGPAGAPGEPGEPGAPGETDIVYHGSEAGYPRPEVEGPVIWIGDANPENKEEFDLWLNTAEAVAGATTDWGIVSALPTEPGLGDTCFFEVATGLWHLVYDEAETHPWAKIGGPSLREVVAELEMNSETPSTSGPKLTVPLAMEALITIGSNRAVPPASAFSANKLYIGGAVHTPCTAIAGHTSQDVLIAKARTTVSKSAEVQNRPYRISAAAAITFIGLYIEVDPYRVG